MLAEDMVPSRLHLAREKLKKMAQKLVGNKMGLIAFAGSSVILSPLTVDYRLLMLFVDSLSTSSVSTQGTNLAVALEQALEAFRRGGEEKDTEGRDRRHRDRKISRSIVLFSDGEDDREELWRMMNILKREKVKVYAIGLGTTEGGRIPIRDASQAVRYYKTDRQGKQVLTKLQISFLKKVAQSTGGSYEKASIQVCKKIEL